MVLSLDFAAQEERYRRNLDSLMPGGKIKGTEAFADYMENRLSSADSLARQMKISANEETKQFGKELGKKIAGGAEGIKAITTVLQDANATKTLEEARNKFETSVGILNDWLKEDPPRHNPASIASLLQEFKGEAFNAIKTQQEAELARFNALFDPAKNPDFATFSKDLGLENNPEATRKRMEAALKKSQEEKLKAFQESLDKSITDLHKFANDERARLATLNLFDQNEKNRKRIDWLIADKLADQQETAATFNEAEPGRYKGININGTDFPVIYTRSDKKITVNNNNIFSMKLSALKFMFSIFTNHFEDMRDLANAIKSSGKESITININYKNPGEMQKLAQDAYHACIEAGFPPKNICIKINGIVVSDVYDKEGKIVPPKGKEEDPEVKLNLRNNNRGFMSEMDAYAKEVAEKLKSAAGETPIQKQAATTDYKAAYQEALDKVKQETPAPKPEVPAPGQQM